MQRLADWLFRLLLCIRAGSAYELELSRELRTVGVCGFDGAWGTVEHWTENFTAHSKVDPATGELVYMGYNLVPVGGPPTVSVGVIDAASRVTHRATLPVTRPSMQHDMVRFAAKWVAVRLGVTTLQNGLRSDQQIQDLRL